MNRKTFIYSFLLGAGSVFTHGLKLNAMQASTGEILVKMVYNNTGGANGLKNAWGLSAWIAPSHCTGSRPIRIFRENWGERFIEMNLGDNYLFREDGQPA